MVYEDDHDIEKDHDVIIMALPGQSYLKETMHKVSTTQVTGEALKKVALGGKGGMGSQGDAREQDKQVLSAARVMVLSDPSQEAFDHNANLDRVVVGFNENQSKKFLHSTWGAEGTPEYFDRNNAEGLSVMDNHKDVVTISRPEGDDLVEKEVEIDRYQTTVTYLDRFDAEGNPTVEKYERMIYNPSRLFGSKEKKGWIKLIKSFGRDYDEFSHSNILDAADAMAKMEELHYEWETNKEFASHFDVAVDGPSPITFEALKDAREVYDETCNYKGAWKYCREGFEWDNENDVWIRDEKVRARRYTIQLVNTQNLNSTKQHAVFLYQGQPLDELERAGFKYSEWTEDLGNGLTKHHQIITYPLNVDHRANWSDKDKERMDKAGYYQHSEEGSYNHNSHVYWRLNMCRKYNLPDEVFDDYMRSLKRKDCVQFLMWQLGRGVDADKDRRDWIYGTVKRRKQSYPEIIAELIKVWMFNEDRKEFNKHLKKTRKAVKKMVEPLTKDIKWVYAKELTVKGKVFYCENNKKKGEDNLNRQIINRLNSRR